MVAQGWLGTGPAVFAANADWSSIVKLSRLVLVLTIPLACFGADESNQEPVTMPSLLRRSLLNNGLLCDHRAHLRRFGALRRPQPRGESEARGGKGRRKPE